MRFDFKDTGTGPVLLFVPGSYSNYSAWKNIQQELKGSYRMISISLPGYSGTQEVREDTDNDMSAMSGFLADVVDHIADPVHLIGHSYGGLVTFAATLDKSIRPLSLITFEGNPIYSRYPDFDSPWLAGTLDMSQRFEEAYASGDPDAAGIIIDFWGKKGDFQAMPERFRDYCRSTVYTNILDWRTAAGFKPFFSEFSAIDVPCSIVRGEFANQAIVDLSAAIALEIPDNNLHVVEGSGHFLISTHPSECAKIIDDHMTAYGEKNQN
jgi:pimeloyl-ACP methyl ester carboxylesterase